MSESSRSRVTITLGRSGQVVKRDGIAMGSSTSFSQMVGNKRSVRERLGNDVDSPANIGHKRQRGDGSAVDLFNDTRLRKDDLRYKIMRKNMMKQNQNSQQGKMDLRNLLSRPAQSSVNSVSTLQRMPEKTASRMDHLEPKRPQSRAGETSGSGYSPPLTRPSNQNIPEFRAQRISDPGRQPSLKSRDGDRHLFEMEDAIRHMHKESYSRAVADLPAMRASKAASRMESGSAYSPWTLDRLRHRSPDDSLATSRGVPALQREEEFQRRFTGTTYDGSRTASYIGKDAFEFSRPASSSHLTKMAPPGGPVKSMSPMVAPLRPETLAPKSSSLAGDKVTVDSFLRSLGLEKYAILLKAEEVDMYALKRMGERDLKELGIPMGPRKKILLALHPHLKQEA